MHFHLLLAAAAVFFNPEIETFKLWL